MSSTWETTTEVWALRSAVISYRKCVSFKTTTICLCQPFLTPPGFGTLTHPQVVGRQQIPPWLHQVSVVNYWIWQKSFALQQSAQPNSLHLFFFQCKRHLDGEAAGARYWPSGAWCGLVERIRDCFQRRDSWKKVSAGDERVDGH